MVFWFSRPVKSIVKEKGTINIHDIAREAGVSTATVSRVINRSPLVEERTRERVKAIIEAHGYTPNGLARGLLQRRSGSIGVLIVDILNPYYATVVHAIEQNLSANGNSVLLCNTGDNHEEKLRYMNTLLEKRVDALVFVGSVYRENDGAADIIKAALKIPVVMINSRIEAKNIFSILCDDRAGIREATDYLLDAHRQRLLFINTVATHSARLKEEAFFATLDERGFPRDRATVIESKTSELGQLPVAIVEAMRKSPFDAVLATDDLFANVAVNTLHSQRVDIPDDVWVVGYNNSYVSEQSYPKLSSVDSCMEEIGTSCATLLATILSGKPVAQPIVSLMPRLVIKDSSG